MDPENYGREAVLRVSSWLRGIWEMRRRGGVASNDDNNPTVQRWVDSLPSPILDEKNNDLIGVTSRSNNVNDNIKAIDDDKEFDTTNDNSEGKENFFVKKEEEAVENVVVVDMTVSSTPISIIPSSPAISCPGASRCLARDPSFQSDSSHCSSVESLLESRKADPEAILLNLGFGGVCYSNTPQNGVGPLSRIPKRFLQPSKLNGIAIDDFVRHQHETSESLDSTSLGYRGLTGSPYVAPSEIVQKIVQRLREHENHDYEPSTYHNASYQLQINNEQSSNLPPRQQDCTRLSVLSPDNRQYLERPRSTSPDMRNKRMIIGQRSFAFGRDGDLIEINPASDELSQNNDDDDSLCECTGTIDVVESIKTMGPIEKTNEAATTTTTTTEKNNQLSNGDSTETVVPTRAGLKRNISIHDEKFNNGSDNESPRRTSEGSNDKSPKPSYFLEQEETRRHSDGTAAIMRKKSLRRQAKIREAPDDEDETTEVLKKKMENEDSGKYEGSRDTRCPHCGRPKTIEDDNDDEENDVYCCFKRMSGAVRSSCLMSEMEKVKLKNKKLEDTVAKSRKELSEIKDMLSTVLSVRMEPGF